MQEGFPYLLLKTYGWFIQAGWGVKYNKVLFIGINEDYDFFLYKSTNKLDKTTLL